jgi:hypothetical protein
MPNEQSLQEQTLREFSLQQAIAEQNSKMLLDLLGEIGTRQRGESPTGVPGHAKSSSAANRGPFSAS